MMGRQAQTRLVAFSRNNVRRGLLKSKLTGVERLAKLKDVFVQLDILHACRTPLVLQSFELLRELRTAVLRAVHVAQQSFPVSFQLSHLHSQRPELFRCLMCHLMDCTVAVSAWLPCAASLGDTVDDTSVSENVA